MAVQGDVFVAESCRLAPGSQVYEVVSWYQEVLCRICRVIVHVGRQFVGEELVHVRLGGVLRSANGALDVGQLLILYLLQLNLLDVLADLLSQQVTQLVANLVPIRELGRQLIGVVAFADEDVVVLSFPDFDCEREDFFLERRSVCGGRGAR